MQGDEAEIRRRGEWLWLRPRKKSWAVLEESLGKFTDDFMKNGRNQPHIQKKRRAFS